MQETKTYWFPAKTYGWGWGLPATWQGWLVLLLYTAILVLASVRFPPDANPLEFFGVAGLATVFLLCVCYVKGEPPSWHWGKKS